MEFGTCEITMIGASVSKPELKTDAEGRTYTSLRVRAQHGNKVPDVYMDFVVYGCWIGQLIHRVRPGTMLYLTGKLEHVPRLTTNNIGAFMRGHIESENQIVILEGENDA